MVYKVFNKSTRPRQLWPLIVVIIAVIFVGGVVGLRVWYGDNLRPVSSSSQTAYFTVEAGESKRQIATALQSAGLIRNARAFETYLRSNEVDILQAGTYVLSPSMTSQQIAAKMASGDVAKNLLTILPGKRIDQIKQAFAKAGYSQSEIDTAFNPATYLGNPALASLPSGASLEGYLYPDSFQKNSSTPAQTIVAESLAETAQKLTPDIITGLTSHGLSVYQGLTLASIVYQETDNPKYEPTVAQVFLSRLSQNMNLQSNVTADYAADIAGVARSTSIDSPYNTYLHAGLPPGPIGNFNVSALNAVAHPSNTSYLYFVADEQTGTVYFATTQADHDAQAKQYCPNTCQ